MKGILSPGMQVTFQTIHIAKEPIDPARPRNPHDDEHRKEHHDKHRGAGQAQAGQETLGRKAQHHRFVPDAAIDIQLHRSKTFIAPYTIP